MIFKMKNKKYWLDVQEVGLAARPVSFKKIQEFFRIQSTE